MSLVCRLEAVHIVLSPPNQRKGKGKAARARKPKKGGGSNTAGKVGSHIGRAIGGAVGLPNLGATLGNLAGTGIRKLFGFGDYSLGPEVTENSFVHPTKAEAVPHFAMDEGYVRVAHREFLADLLSGTEASPGNSEQVINPGNSRCFPWLSAIAQAFEQYKMLGLVFEYRTTSGNAVSSTNSALGSLSFVTHYNVNLPNFTTKAQVLNNYFATGTIPSANMLHPVECESTQMPTNCLFIRGINDSLPGVTSDARFYDLGRLQIYTTGSQSQFTCGELWVSYDILLIKPRFPAGVPRLVVDDNAGFYSADPGPEIHQPELQILKCCEEKKEG